MCSCGCMKYGKRYQVIYLQRCASKDVAAHPHARDCPFKWYLSISWMRVWLMSRDWYILLPQHSYDQRIYLLVHTVTNGCVFFFPLIWLTFFFFSDYTGNYLGKKNLDMIFKGSMSNKNSVGLHILKEMCLVPPKRKWTLRPTLAPEHVGRC